jgi:tripartite-type tricarboxylate transporter receptor subunit TctC
MMKFSLGTSYKHLARLLLLPLLVAVGAATAQTYPDKSKPIRLIVPFNAGTSTDVLGRALGRAMTDVAGLNVIIDNVAGAEAVLGARAAKQAPPDGYTMFLTTLSTQAVNPHMLANLPYDPIADFIPLVGVAKAPLMMNVGPGVPFKSAREFFAAARANPGKYSFGSASATVRLASEMLAQAAGVQFLAVPYKNFSDLMTNVASGEVHFMIADLGTAGPFYKSGVRPLMTVSGKRVASYPDVPTAQDEGLGDYNVAGWYATYFPAKTPPAIVSAMRNIVREAAKSKHVTDVMATFAFEPLLVEADELDAFQRAEYEKWGKAVKAANLGPAK